MAEPKCLSELQLIALMDDELPTSEASTARSHLSRCFVCNRLYEALRREDDVLRAAVVAEVAPEQATRREVGRELGWVVAAGLLFSFGLATFRRLFFQVDAITTETPLPDTIPVLSNLLLWFLSFLDYEQMGTQLAYGGILIMTIIGIAMASNAIRRTRAGAMPLLLAAALVPGLGALSTPAEAFEVIRSEDGDCSVPAGRVVNDDVLMMCDSGVIAGTVLGDVYFLGRSLEVSGRVEGDLFGGAQDIAVEGSVGLSVRGFAESVSVSGEVGRGLFSAGQNITIEPGGSVGGSMVVAGERISVNGPVGRSLLAGVSTLELDAPVGGDLRVAGETLRLGSGASVTGAARYRGPSEPEREPGASRVEWTEPEPDEGDVWDTSSSVATRWAMGLLLGLVLVLLAARPVSAVAAVAGRPLAPILFGLLLAVGMPFAAILFCITFVGLPLGFTTIGVYLFLIYAARIVAAMVIGQAILGLASTNWQRIGRIALGLGILALAVELPVIGAAVWLLTVFLGLGAVALWVWRSRPASAASSLASRPA